MRVQPIACPEASQFATAAAASFEETGAAKAADHAAAAQSDNIFLKFMPPF